MKTPRWLWRRKQKEALALQVRLVDRPVCNLRADEFRADKDLAHLAATVLASPNMQLMIAVLRNEHPGNEVLPADAGVNERVAAQARSEGYTIALATLESLGVKADLPERLVSTFGAVEPGSNAQTG